jgi:hypothetical protein
VHAFYTSPVVQEVERIPPSGGRRSPGVLTVLAPAVIAVLVVGVVVVHLRQSSAQKDDIAEISAAFQRADCSGAVAALDSARTRTVIFGGRAQIPAGTLDRITQCAEVDRARAFGEAGKNDEAVVAYLSYLREHRGSPLARIIPDRLGRALRDGDTEITTGLCRDLAAVVAAGDLAPNDEFPDFFTDCGVKLAAGTGQDDRKGARALLTEVRTSYPDSRDLGRAAVAEARARVALGPDDGTMTSPYRVSGPSNGASVRYVNHTPWPAVLAMSGAKDGRVVELGGCPECELFDEASNGPPDCESDGAKAVTIDLDPGDYRVAIEYEGENTPPGNSGRWTLSKGRYAECYYAIK